MRTLKRIGPALLALLVPAGLPAATPEDDLAVVKRAVEERPNARGETPRSERGVATPEPELKPSAREPQWLRMRIEHKGQQRGRVSVNLSLALVRALGDDSSIGAGWLDKDRKRLKLSEVLRALDNGQNLVEIEDQKASVRIWVE